VPELSLTQIIYGYLVIINVITFFFFGIDKAKASWHSKTRISEKILWTLALIGGSLGALLGMHVFRHKTKKVSFHFILVLIILLQSALIATLGFLSGN